MKTIEEIKSDIETVIALHPQKDTPKKDYDAAGRRVYFLRLCINYLERDATEAFIKKMLADMKHKKQVLEDGYGQWLKNFFDPKVDSRNPRTVYNSSNGIANINNQIKALKYLLS